MSTNSSSCPECDAQLSVPSDAIQGEVVTCRDCGSAFELVMQADASLFTLRPAELEEEDWGE